MIDVTVNKQNHSITEQTTLAALLEQLNIAPIGSAIAINGTIIPRSLWSQHSLQACDEVDIFQVIAGG